MKKSSILVFVLLLVLVLLAGIAAGCAQTTPEDTGMTEDTAAIEESTNIQEGEMHKVQIDVQDYGTILLELDGGTAPETVTNFIELAKSGFYDGLTFHRIIDGFMIQGGDPEGTGMGGSGKNIKGEFASNGVQNPISHVRGTISMARSGMPDSASSQFFIVHQDSTFLDGDYAAFGKVIEGIEVVDKIAKGVPVVDGNGTVQEGKKPIITKVTVLD